MNLENRKYGILFFESFYEARKAREKILADCNDCDQLNVAIKEEGNMDDQDLLSIDPKVKIFAGEAWFLIHNRRVEENWYKF